MDRFATLLEQETPRLRRYAMALHPAHGDRADDLVQDTLERAIAKQHLWQPGTNLRAWLFTLMHNLRVNDVRRRVREGTSVDADAMCDELPSISDPSAPLQFRDLDRCLGKLLIGQRQAILLVGLEGLSYREIATIFGTPVGTVRSRLSRGRAVLRQLMGITEPADLPVKVARGLRAIGRRDPPANGLEPPRREAAIHSGRQGRSRAA